MGWPWDNKRREPPKRVPPFKPNPVTPTVFAPKVSVSTVAVDDGPLTEIASKPAPVPAQTPKPVPVEQPAPAATTGEIPYSTQPRWCKPKPGVPAQWSRVNTYAKVFLFPGMKHEIRPRKPGDPGEYRDAIPGESITLYHNTFVGEPGNTSGSVFVDDTTEALFRAWFDYSS